MNLIDHFTGQTANRDWQDWNVQCHGIPNLLVYPLPLICQLCQYRKKDMGMSNEILDLLVKAVGSEKSDPLRSGNSGTPGGNGKS